MPDRTCNIGVQTNPENEIVILRLNAVGADDPPFTYEEAQGYIFELPTKNKVIKFPYEKSIVAILDYAVREVKVEGSPEENTQVLSIVATSGEVFRLEGATAIKVFQSMQQNNDLRKTD